MADMDFDGLNDVTDQVFQAWSQLRDYRDLLALIQPLSDEAQSVVRREMDGRFREAIEEVTSSIASINVAMLNL